MASKEDERRLSPYRKLLLNLSFGLSSVEVGMLKIAGRDFIPHGISENISNGLEFFDFLEQDGMIGPQNLALLKDMLEAIIRVDLAQKIQAFSSANGEADDQHGNTPVETVSLEDRKEIAQMDGERKPLTDSFKSAAVLAGGPGTHFAGKKDDSDKDKSATGKGADLPLKSRFGRNLLQRASTGGNVAIIEEMLSRGFDINSKDSNGNTAVMIAARCGKMEAVTHLLDKGADLSLKGEFGRNLLHNASYGGNVAIIETMLSRGFDINSKDSNGHTALMIAAAEGNTEAVKYLNGRGAR